MAVEQSLGLDPYLLALTFVLGAASAFFYIQSLPDSEWHKYRQVYNEHKRLVEAEAQREKQKQQQQDQNSSPHANNPINSDTNDSSAPDNPLKSDSKQNVDTHKKPVRIYIDASWDLCHSGHYNAIRQAKSLGDYLVVGVHASDEMVANKRRPVMTDSERVACLKACKWVDKVVFDVPCAASCDILDRNDVSCDFCAQSEDVLPASRKDTSRLKILKSTPGVSATTLIERILDAIRCVGAREDNKMPQKCSKTLANAPKAAVHAKSSKIDNFENEAKLDAMDAMDATDDMDDMDDMDGVVWGRREVSASWTHFLGSSRLIAAFSSGRVASAEDKVVYIDGVWDVFHAGHVAALKAARELGTFLYVGIFDDAVVRSRLGGMYPIMSIQERVLNVLSCKFVDEVVICCPWRLDNNVVSALGLNYVAATNVSDGLNAGEKRFEYVKSKNMFVRIENEKLESTLTTQELVQRIAKNCKE